MFLTMPIRGGEVFRLLRCCRVLHTAAHTSDCLASRTILMLLSDFSWHIVVL
jgi:hypothetical protein